jgi:hypothetical protein
VSGNTTAGLPVAHPTFLDREGNTWYRWKDTLVKPYVADMYGELKHLTDAELAAEYWAQDSKCRHEQWIETVRGDDDYEGWERAMQSRMYEQLNALHRFATLPHYDKP